MGFDLLLAGSAKVRTIAEANVKTGKVTHGSWPTSARGYGSAVWRGLPAFYDATVYLVFGLQPSSLGGFAFALVVFAVWQAVIFLLPASSGQHPLGAPSRTAVEQLAVLSTG